MKLINIGYINSHVIIKLIMSLEQFMKENVKHEMASDNEVVKLRTELPAGHVNC